MTDNPFTLFFLGAEQPAWRTMLGDLGVENVGLSYWSVRRRLPKKKSYSMDWGFKRVFLDSGGYSANKKAGEHSQREWMTYSDEYDAFVMDHIDDVEMVSEFDCLALGESWMARQRERVWDKIPPEKFLPIWHPDYGVKALEELGERYQRIGISQDNIAVPGTNVTPYLNKLAAKGVQLHGLAMSRPDAISHVRFSSVSSTSWLSPMRFGETILWDGARLVRYPTKMKDQARLRHRNDFERAGFDAARIQADDSREVTRVSVWSWLQYEASVCNRVTATARPPAAEDTETPGSAVAARVDSVRNPAATRTRSREEISPLPVFGYREVEGIDTETNEKVRHLLPVLSAKPLRTCNTCFVRTSCPAFEEDASCAYEIPIEVRTPGQRRALMNGLVEMQAQRVAFMRFREELEGGYADPNLSQEYDRLLKTFQVMADIEDDRDFFRMTVESKSKAGVLSRLFGRDVGDAAQQLPNPLDAADTDRVISRVIKGSVE